MYIKAGQIMSHVIRRIFLVSITSMFWAGCVQSLPQEDILNVMIDLQTDDNPISLARYEEISRSEKIELRLYLEGRLAGIDSIPGSEKKRILWQFDSKVGGGAKSEMQGRGVNEVVDRLPAGEKKYLQSLALGSDSAPSLRRALVRAKALLYSSQGIANQESLQMANSYLALSTESIAVGSGIDAGELGEVVSKSLQLDGTPVESANSISKKIVGLAESTGSGSGMDFLKGIVFNNPYETRKDLDIKKIAPSFGVGVGIDKAAGKVKVDGLSEIGVGLRRP